jgi:hypothetical protein
VFVFNVKCMFVRRSYTHSFFGVFDPRLDEFVVEVLLSLDCLNRSFSAWLDVSYHQRTHSETGQRYERELGAHGEAVPPPAPGKPQHNYLDLLVEQHEQSLQQRSQGIDFRQLPPARSWSFSDFAHTLGQLLGRRGGLSAFTSDELEALGKLHARVDCQEPLLRRAVEQSRKKTIPAIAFELQRLSDQEEIANP